MKKINVATFVQELKDADALVGIISWRNNGTIVFEEDSTSQQRAAIQAVLDAHDPLAIPPKSKRDLAKEKLLARDVSTITDPIVKDIVEFLQAI